MHPGSPQMLPSTMESWRRNTWQPVLKNNTSRRNERRSTCSADAQTENEMRQLEVTCGAFHEATARACNHYNFSFDVRAHDISFVVVRGTQIHNALDEILQMPAARRFGSPPDPGDGSLTACKRWSAKRARVIGQFNSIR